MSTNKRFASLQPALLATRLLGVVLLVTCAAPGVLAAGWKHNAGGKLQRLGGLHNLAEHYGAPSSPNSSNDTLFGSLKQSWGNRSYNHPTAATTGAIRAWAASQLGSKQQPAELPSQRPGSGTPAAPGPAVPDARSALGGGPHAGDAQVNLGDFDQHAAVSAHAAAQQPSQLQADQRLADVPLQAPAPTAASGDLQASALASSSAAVAARRSVAEVGGTDIGVADATGRLAAGAVAGALQPLRLAHTHAHQRVLVQVREGADLARVVEAALGVGDLAATGLVLHELAPNLRIDLVELPFGFLLDAGEVARRLDDHPDIVFAETDRLVKTQASRAGALYGHDHRRLLQQAVAASTSPNDTLFDAQYDKRYIGLTPRGRTWPGAWARSRGSSAIIVAVIDTGIDVAHPDLLPNLWVNPGEIPGNGKDDDGNGHVDDVHGLDAIDGSGNLTDTDGHGTHCAGNIGAAGSNGKGISGVTQRVQLMGCRAIVGINPTLVFSAAIRCIDYALRMGAHIMSNSWGTVGVMRGARALQVAINKAEAAGVLFVVAAGNEALDADQDFVTPAGFSNANILAVAATDIADDLTSFSNYGARSVHLAAPGSFIVSTAPGGRYMALSGTSMACPQVAGAAALVLGIYGQAGANMTGRARELRTLLLAAADPLDVLAGRVASGGRLNVGRAVAAIPTNLSVFDADPAARLPWSRTLPPAPRLDPNFEPVVIQAQPLVPGREVDGLAKRILAGPLPAAGPWLREAGRLAGGNSTYDCLCSTCLGPERVYTFTLEAQPGGPEWYALTIEAEPASQLVISMFQRAARSQRNVVLANATRAQTSNSTRRALPPGEVMIVAGCGGQTAALQYLPVAVGSQYYVILDGIGGYNGSYNVTFRGRPLATEILWDDIVGGFSARGSLPGQGLPLLACRDGSPECGCSDSPDVVFRFTAAANATLAIATGPYDIYGDDGPNVGVVPSVGNVCIVDGVGAVVGPCDIFKQVGVDQACSATESEGPETIAYAGLANTSVVHLPVVAGSTYHVAVDSEVPGIDTYTLNISVIQPLPKRPNNIEVPWRTIATVGSGPVPQAFGFIETGSLTRNLSRASAQQDCPCSPGECRGPEVVYTFRASQTSQVAVVSWPFYAADDLGLAGEAACEDSGCYAGVVAYTYEEGPDGSLAPVQCGFQDVLQQPDYKIVFDAFNATLDRRYYVVVDTIVGAVLAGADVGVIDSYGANLVAAASLTRVETVYKNSATSSTSTAATASTTGSSNRGLRS